MLEKLAKDYPADTLVHVKRVRHPSPATACANLQVFIAPAESTARDDIEEYALKNGLHNVCTCLVPARVSLTATQFEASKKLWPVSFHENKQ